jgi:C4-dicarboxylate transporter, DctM subunit
MDIWVTLGLIAIAILLILGVEIVVCLGLGAVLLTVLTGSFPLANIGVAAFSGLDIFPLLALPLYILTGDLIAAGGISRLLVEFARELVGWLRGGLALTSLWAAEGFAAISGSNSATVAAIGRIMVPELRKDGYPIDFIAGTIASCGTVGIITPPSIVFIIYGVAAGVSVGDLFLGGILPGLLMVTCMSSVAFLVCRRFGYGTTTPFRIKSLMVTAWKSKLAFTATAIILGGIYGGVFTPTEAAAVAVAYCFIAGVFVTRELPLKDLPQVMERSAGITGIIAPIVAMAIVLSEILAVLRLPQTVVSWLLGASEDPMVVMVMINVILFAAGCVMETTPNVLLLTPLLAPVASSLGYNPVHFGVIMVVNLAIGFITPPVGLNLYVSSSITGVPLTQVALRAFPYIIALCFALTLIIIFPSITTVFLAKR